MLLSTAYHIIQLVVTIMGIIIAFSIAFTTESNLRKSYRTRELLYTMEQQKTHSKEELQTRAKSLFDAYISHLKKEGYWLFSGLAIITVLILQSVFWTVTGNPLNGKPLQLSLMRDVILVIVSALAGIIWTVFYAHKTINSLIKHFRHLGEDFH